VSLSIDAEALRAKMTVTPAEVGTAISRQRGHLLDARTGARQPHPAENGGQGRGSREEGRRERCSRKVKAGGDFAALAKQYSEDDASKVNGGDLDYLAEARW
jgi:hypothetical protein